MRRSSKLCTADTDTNVSLLSVLLDTTSWSCALSLTCPLSVLCAVQSRQRSSSVSSQINFIFFNRQHPDDCTQRQVAEFASTTLTRQKVVLRFTHTAQELVGDVV
eukprot:PhM_4_TR16757/c0_g2_i2/m.26633